MFKLTLGEVGAGAGAVKTKGTLLLGTGAGAGTGVKPKGTLLLGTCSGTCTVGKPKLGTGAGATIGALLLEATLGSTINSRHKELYC